MLPTYQLSATLEGHSQDVRAVCSPNARTIVSASRDTSAKLWELGKDGAWTLARTMNDPDGKFVSSLAWVVIDDQPYIACGSGSSKISLYATSDESAAPIRLEGHAQNVCCLASNRSGLLISGSWDKTAIVWKRDKQVIKFDKHIQAVWDVKCLGEDRFLTASADKTINLFDMSGTTLATFYGHTDCVRSLAVIADGSGFWSAGNDALVMKWSFNDTKPVATLSGHTSFVYAVAALPDGEGVVSSGEDGTVKIWKGEVAVQTIVHPTVSVWTVNVLPSGDIISGASDSAVRIFTRSENRLADQEILRFWDQAVASKQINKAQIGDVKHSDLPGVEALAKQGKSEGQVIMIKNEGQVQAYQWQSAGQTWQQVGEVVDAVGSGRKQLFKGVEYDYVFDVDIADGVPPLKLPFNTNENPYAAAERFLNMNELPLTYTEQVVKFIESNTKGVELGGPRYVDPFTGAGAYGAGDAGPSAPAPSGGSVYRDPYTGGGANTQGAAQKGDFTPIKVPQHYKAINATAVKGKITEFNDALKAESSKAESLDQEEESTLSEIFAQLSLPAIAQQSASERWDAGVLLRAMNRWPTERRFPLIDVCRVLCATSGSLASHGTSPEDSVIECLLRACDWHLEWESSKPREINTMLAMRGLANLTATAAGKRRWSSDEAPEILDRLAASHSFSSLNKNTRVAYASIALNLSVLAVNDELRKSMAQPLLQLITNILSNESDEPESAYRALVALGNLSRSKTLSGSLPVGDVQLAREVGEGLAKQLGEQRLKTVVAGI